MHSRIYLISYHLAFWVRMTRNLNYLNNIQVTSVRKEMCLTRFEMFQSSLTVAWASKHVTCETLTRPLHSSRNLHIHGNKSVIKVWADTLYWIRSFRCTCTHIMKSCVTKLLQDMRIGRLEWMCSNKQGSLQAKSCLSLAFLLQMCLPLQPVHLSWDYHHLQRKEVHVVRLCSMIFTQSAYKSHTN